MTMTMFTMNPRVFLTELWGDPPPFPVPIQISPRAASLFYEEFDRLDQDLAEYAEYVDRDIYTTLEITAPSNISVHSHPESGEADIGALEVCGLKSKWPANHARTPTSLTEIILTLRSNPDHA